MKNPMKSSVDSSDVPVDNSIGTVSELSIHAGCADVPMNDPKASMCVRACVCTHESNRNIRTSAQANIHAGFLVPIQIKHRNSIGTGV